MTPCEKVRSLALEATQELSPAARLQRSVVVVFLLPALLVLAAALPAEALTLFVAPEGNDAWSGQIARPNETQSDGPVASLTGARDALRRLRAAGSLASGEIIVTIADGEYPIREPLILAPEDSGHPGQTVLFQAAPGAHPLFSGERKITGFAPVSGGLWQVEIPEARDGQWTFEQLWVNGHRATRARTPNDSYLLAVSAASEPVAGVPLAGPLEQTAINLRPEDIAALSVLSPEELHEVNVVVYHSWQTSRHRIASLDAEKGALQFTGPARWPFFQLEPYHRVHLENYRAALDAPGEWFLNRRGQLLYLPRPGEEIATAVAVAPLAPRWIELHGDPEHNRFVEHIEFRGLRFAGSQYLLPEIGWSDAQADATLGAAIEADGAREVALTQCDFSHLGTYALWFRHGCHAARVQHCHFHEMGSGGIKVGETTVPKTEAGQTDHITLEDNIIQGGGRYFTGSVGIWVGHSGDNVISHNDIGDFYYSAISLGWTWGFKPSLAVRNCVEWNHLHHLGWGVLSDLGAVYTLGPSEGTVIAHNVVHDIASASYGGWGLYADEGSSSILLENNLVYRTKSGGFHQHYGRDNLVRNNIFADAREMQLRHSRTEDHLAFTFEQNIVLWHQGKLLGHLDANWRGPQVKLDRNLYWRSDEQPYDFAGLSREAWQASGQDQHSLFVDPLFVEPEVGNFRLPPGSPAEQIGFQAFDFAKAGVEGDPAWRQLAAARRYPPMDFSPLTFDPPPLQLKEGFEGVAPGPHFHILRMQTGGSESAAVVTDEIASHGRQCLKITDGPDLKPSYNPHFFYQPRHRMGVSKVAFDLRVEAKAEVVQEWRNTSGGGPYRTGPMLHVKNGALFVGAQKLIDFPPLQWVHLEMEAQLGGHAPGTWTLQVTLPEQSPRRFENLKFIHPDARALEWLGFSSPGTERASYWIDDLEISNHLDAR